MGVATLDGSRAAGVAGLPGHQLLALARIACEGGVTRAELSRELSPLLANQKAGIEQAVAALKASASISEARGRLKITAKGAAALGAELGAEALPADWPAMRDERLVAKALGIERATPQRLKALNRPDQLRAEVLARAFGLKLKGASAARLRTQLAVVALERAFGNTIKGGLGSGRGLSPKASRQLAAQLLRKPRDPRTDQRLIAALAAEQAGAKETDAESLRVALLRGMPARARPHPQPSAPVIVVPTAPVLPVQAPAEPSSRPAAATRPDLKGFARQVQAAARSRAEGWPGMRKAFISHVWEAIAAQHPGWGLSEVEFKAMLAEAHRTGHVALANADLKDKSRIKELQASAVTYKNTVWHFVRVAE
jgi:hypothetical protein